MSLDSDDQVYMGDIRNQHIQGFLSDESFIACFDSKVSWRTSFKCPRGLAMAPDGKLFTAGESSDNVTVLTRGGQFVRSFEVESPVGETVDAAGFSFVTTFANPGPVSIFDPKGSIIHKVERFNYPTDVKFSPDGFVWISD